MRLVPRPRGVGLCEPRRAGGASLTLDASLQIRRNVIPLGLDLGQKVAILENPALRILNIRRVFRTLISRAGVLRLGTRCV